MKKLRMAAILAYSSVVDVTRHKCVGNPTIRFGYDGDGL